jgi:hypothetical protein
MGRDTICEFSGDVEATMDAMGGKFDLEDCSFFESCSHKVTKFDTAPDGEKLAVELSYCAIDWYKLGPILAVVVLLIAWLYRRTRRSAMATAAAPVTALHSRARHALARRHR